MRTFNRYASLSQLLKEAPFTFSMLVINIAVYVIEFILEFFDISLFQEGALYGPFVIEYGEYYRLVTSAFLHGGIIHLLFNVGVGLYVLTAGLERLIGTWKTALIYIFSGLLAGGAVLLFNYNIPTIGASGAIFGALGALLYVTVFRHDLLHEAERNWILQLILVNAVFTLLLSNISIAGHFGGLAAGFLLSFLFISRKEEPQIYYSREYFDRQQRDNDYFDDDENDYYS